MYLNEYYINKFYIDNFYQRNEGIAIAPAEAGT